MNFSITLAIVIITGLLSYRAFNDRALFNSLKHYPVIEHQNKEYYRMLSSGFIHGSWLHLLINLYVLYEFGRTVETMYMGIFGEAIGRFLFLLMYLLTIIAADLPTFFKHQNNPSYSAIGASGGVSGIVFVYILFFPWATLALYGIIPFPAIVGGIAYLIYSSWASQKRNDGIDHSAHFYGALFGVVFTLALKPSLAINFVQQLMSKFG